MTVNKEFMQEGMDGKRLVLCLKKSLGRILLLTICGGLLSGGLYLLIRHFFMETKWQTRSQFYLQFVFDPKGEVEQSYNGYTWNDLLHADPIVGEINKAILESKDEGWQSLYPKEKTSYPEVIREAIKGEILSDRRLLLVTITTHQKEKTALLRTAMEEGLLRYAKGQQEILSIELIRSTEPELLLWDNRTVQAVIGGGVLCFLIALFAWWFAHILDDSLYVIADGEKRFPFPVLGLLVKTGEGEGRQPYEGELAENSAYLLKGMERIGLLSVENQCLQPQNRPKGNPTEEQTKAIFDRITKERNLHPNRETLTGSSCPPDSGWGEFLRSLDGVILLVPFGKRNGRQIHRTISFLKNQNCRIQGILIVEGEEAFWRSYYGSGGSRKKGKNSEHGSNRKKEI